MRQGRIRPTAACFSGNGCKGDDNPAEIAASRMAVSRQGYGLSPISEEGMAAVGMAFRRQRTLALRATYPKYGLHINAVASPEKIFSGLFLDAFKGIRMA